MAMRGRFPLVFLSAVLLAGLAFGLRVYRIDYRQITTDEAFSWSFSGWPASRILDRIMYDGHPPGYYLTLNAIRPLTADRIDQLRLVSAVFGAASVLLVFAATFRMASFQRSPSDSGRGAQLSAICAAAIVAIHGLHVAYGQTARMYAPGVAFCALAELLVIAASAPGAAPSAASGRSWRWMMTWLSFGAAASLSLYMHYSLLFSVAAMFLFSVWLLAFPASFDRKRILAGSLVAAGVVAIAFGGWIPTLGFQTRSVINNFWIPAGTTADSLEGLSYFVFGFKEVSYGAGGVAAAVLVASLFALPLRRNPMLMLPILLAAVPIAGTVAFALATSRPIALERVLMFAHLGVVQVVALAVGRLPTPAAAAATIILATNCAAGWYSQLPTRRETYAADALAAIRSRTTDAEKPPMLLHAHAGMLLVMKYHAAQDGFVLQQKAAGHPPSPQEEAHWVHAAALEDDQWIEEGAWNAMGRDEVWKLNVGKYFMRSADDWELVERIPVHTGSLAWILTRHRRSSH